VTRSHAGVTVTAVDAHHCPGAAVLLFELSSGQRYVHCGDMRYHPKMKNNAYLKRFVNPDAVFLDTTYCHPKHTFPPQAESVEAIAALCEGYVAEDVPHRCADATASALGCCRLQCNVCPACCLGKAWHAPGMWFVCNACETVGCSASPPCCTPQAVCQWHRLDMCCTRCAGSS
jgi:hypothetical protein